MARRHDGLARNLGSGPSANDNHAGPCASSALPPGAQALIEPVPLATNQGGRARRGQWRVRFAPRWRPVACPLTGWTGGGDPLETIELLFPDLETAADYCRRQGLRFSVHGEPRGQRPLQRNRRRCCDAGAVLLADRSACVLLRHLSDRGRRSMIVMRGSAWPDRFPPHQTSNERTIDAKIASYSRLGRGSGNRRCRNGHGGRKP